MVACIALGVDVWKKKPLDTNQISDLLKLIANLKQNQITEEAVAFDWIKRRIQSLQARVTFGFEYQGASDPSRYLWQNRQN